MTDALNCQKCYVTAGPQIISKNSVFVDIEIVTEN
jgi:hypothetical protein